RRLARVARPARRRDERLPARAPARTGNGAILTTGGGGGGGGAMVLGGAVVDELDGAGRCACWQPLIAAASRPSDPSQAAALRTRKRR
ncbi:hypothetical protein, partial [Mycobacterium sp. 1245801.1]|uniref:hypothetical protein n=1 Tax=Mycobacterium sp. 1245801.1 TaxID=1834075 RepID=UPI001E34DDFF